MKMAIGLLIAACFWMSAPAMADDAGVMAAIKGYNDAVDSDDVERIRSNIEITSDIQGRAFNVMADVCRSGQRIYAATLKRFGKETLESDRVARTSFPAPFPKLPVEGIRASVTGTQVTLVGPDGPISMKLVKSGTEWKIDAGIFPKFTEEELARQTKILRAVSAQIDQTTEDVAAGHFRTPEEVIVIMEHRVQKAVRATESETAIDLGATTKP